MVKEFALAYGQVAVKHMQQELEQGRETIRQVSRTFKPSSFYYLKSFAAASYPAGFFSDGQFSDITPATPTIPAQQLPFHARSMSYISTATRPSDRDALAANLLSPA